MTNNPVATSSLLQLSRATGPFRACMMKREGAVTIIARLISDFGCVLKGGLHLHKFQRKILREKSKQRGGRELRLVSTPERFVSNSEERKTFAKVDCQVIDTKHGVKVLYLNFVYSGFV